MTSILVQPNKNQIKNIKKELNEDDKKLKHYVKLFYDWLKCEDHLPDNVDQRFVENYIRMCKYDLQKAKNRFEKLIISTSRYNKYYNHGRLNPDFFSPYKFHRMATVLPRLTPEGYRMYVLHFEDTDITHFNMETLLKYVYFVGNYIFHEDFNSGMICIFDFRNAGVHILSKFDMMTFKNAVEICINIMPTRIKALHILNLPVFAEILYACALAFIKEKIRKRIVLHKTVDDLLNYYDRDLLPKELGGTLRSLKEIGDDWKEHFMRSEKWLKKTEDLKLMGPVPKNKQNEMGDYNIGGSFRQLAID